MARRKKLIGLVDGDIIKFKAAMACEYTLKHIFDKDIPQMPLTTLRYVDDIKAFLAENELTMDDVVIQEVPILEPVENVYYNIKSMVKAIKKKFHNKGTRIFLSGSNNFREELAAEMPYKGNRWSKEKRDSMRAEGKWIEWLDATEDKFRETPRPTHENAALEYLIKHCGAEVVEGMEADDAMGICQASDTCIVSIDKDLKMIPGWHQNLDDLDEDPEYISEEEAIYNYYRQILTGDRTDNIPGIKGIANKTADKLLADVPRDEVSLGNAVREIYMDKLNCSDEEAAKLIKQRGSLLWILRTERR